MLLRLLRLLAFALMFFFIYRVIVAAYRYLTGESRKRTVAGPETPPDLKKSAGSEYPDVRDAQFKDLPPKSEDSQKPAS